MTSEELTFSQKVVADQGRYMLHPLEHEESLPIGRWHHQRVRVAFEEIISLTEGKALLECYNDLFRYLGHVIAQQRQQHPIAAATLVTLC